MRSRLSLVLLKHRVYRTLAYSNTPQQHSAGARPAGDHPHPMPFRYSSVLNRTKCRGNARISHSLLSTFSEGDTRPPAQERVYAATCSRGRLADRYKTGDGVDVKEWITGNNGLPEVITA